MAAATREPRLLARFYVRCVLRGHQLDLQLSRDGCPGWDYSVTVTEVGGEAVFEELLLPVRWDAMDEGTRLAVLALYMDGVLRQHARWRRRMDAAVEQALRDARVRLGLPDPG